MIHVPPPNREERINNRLFQLSGGDDLFGSNKLSLMSYRFMVVGPCGALQVIFIIFFLFDTRGWGERCGFMGIAIGSEVLYEEYETAFVDLFSCKSITSVRLLYH
jgi:hypothetical protein